MLHTSNAVKRPKQKYKRINRRKESYVRIFLPRARSSYILLKAYLAVDSNYLLKICLAINLDVFVS